MSTTIYRLKLHAAGLYERGQTTYIASVRVRKEGVVGHGEAFYTFEVEWAYDDREDLGVQMGTFRFAALTSLEAAHDFTVFALRAGSYTMIDFESIERVEG